jgi:prohibitin 2
MGAVEAKQVAQQEAERAKFIVEKAEQERKSIVIRAEAEAEAAILISKALEENPNFVELRKIEAAKDIAKTLAKGNNRVFLNSDLLYMDLSPADKEKESSPTLQPKSDWRDVQPALKKSK